MKAIVERIDTLLDLIFMIRWHNKDNQAGAGVATFPMADVYTQINLAYQGCEEYERSQKDR